MNNEVDGATGFLLSIATLLLIVAAFFLQGLYLMLAWSWVMVPIFKLPALTYWGATGISVMWRIIFKTPHKNEDNSADILKQGVTVLSILKLGATGISVDTLLMGMLWLVSLGI
ncbi:hypothetical protein [Levilactobacillus brevis]|uniref:hypothetical protein n=1 Tax=Levilactobacillus brevis TaxID=1580 RepID=UPI001BDE7F32|nr:hypothetical protein [Levilactobacillus brevis]